jgi:NADH/F420H2 dehydrogenase subunit C
MSGESKLSETQQATLEKDNSTPVIEPGPLGQVLKSKGVMFDPLGADAGGVEMIRATPENLLNVAEALKNLPGCKFDLLLSVSAVDWKTHRESVTHLYSTTHHHYLTLKAVVSVQGDAVEILPSLVPVWPAADWHERESYDLMGIHYEGHPNLKRIMMPEDWIGHPLRKDYKEEDPRLIWNRR